MTDATYRFTTDETDRRWRTEAAVRSLAEHLGGEGVSEDDWWVDYEYESGPGKIADPVRALEGIAAVADAVESQARTYVWEARKLGRSWTDIGAALRISKQAAHKRFSTLDPTRNGRAIDHKTQGGSPLH